MSFSIPISGKLLRRVVLMITVWIPWTTANSAVIDEIASDFKPLSGVVVMASNGEYVIDLDKSKGVVVGDIFSVIAPGKKIVHPVTKKVLGNLEEVKGILKVSRIKPGFSFTRPLGKAVDIKRGDPIRRYGNLDALFWDYTGKGRAFFAELQGTLSALKWQDYETAQRSRPDQPQPIPENIDAIIFILTNQGVEVRDSQFFVLHSYSPPESLSAASTGPSDIQKGQPQAKLAPALPVAKPAPQTAPKEIPRFKPEYERAQTIGKIVSYSVMTDFVRNKNQLLMASTNGTEIEIYDVTDELHLITQITPSYPGQILSLKWWRPSEKEPLYLTAVSWADNSVKGSIFTLKEGNLTPFIEEFPRILGTFDLDGDNRPETLLGQEFDGENFFGGNVRELKLIKGKLKSFKPLKPLPRRFTVLGSLFADLNGNGQLETAFIRKGIMYIYTEKKLLHKSPKHMGGSLSFLTYDIDPTVKNIMPTSASFEVSPIAIDLDGDGLPEILTVASERDIIGDIAAGPGVKKSWLEVLKFRDGRFVKGTLGEKLDTPLQGLVVDDQRVLLVTSEPGDIFGKGRNSHLLAYNLDQ